MTNSNGPSDDTIAAYAAQLLDLESEIEKKQADKKDVYANARDTYGKLFANSLKLAIKRHRMDSEKLAEAEETDAEAERMAAIIARGLVARGARAHAHVEIIEEFDAETGEVLETDSQAKASVGNADNSTAHGSESGVELGSAPVGSGDVTRPSRGGGTPASYPSAMRNGFDGTFEGQGATGAGTAGETPATGANITQLHRHNPDTHFLNSKGLARLHGCQEPEACASSQPRVKLCFACSTRHDGPVASEVSA